MPISRDVVRDCVVDVLRNMVNTAEAPDIGEGADPIHGLGLESDDGLDFACEISDRLGFHFPDDKNPFVDDAGHRPRRVGEIVDLILPMIPNAKEAIHG